MYDGIPTRSIVLASVSCSGSFLALLLRFYARSKTNAKYGMDDWWAVIAILTLYSWFGVFLFCERYRPVENSAFDTSARRILFVKGAYIGLIVSPFPTTAAKFSIIFFCRRIFYNDQQFRKANAFVGLLCLLWFIVVVLRSILFCVPIRKYWTPDIDGKCMKLQDWMIISEAPNSAIDFVMIALPFKIIKDLRLSLINKIALYFTFFLGGFVGIFGLIRIACVYKPDSISIRLLGLLISVQHFLGFLCTCFPTYRPLLPKSLHIPQIMRDWIASLTTLFSRRLASSASKPSISENIALHNRNQPRYHQYDDLDGSSNNNNTIALPIVKVVASGAPIAIDRGGRESPLNAMNAQREVQFV